MPEIIGIITELAICVCIVWLLSFLSSLLHEAGHALGYLVATESRKWHIRVGWGKKLLDTGKLTVKLIPFDGFFTPLETDRIDTEGKLITVLAGGPAMSLILVIGLLLLKYSGISFGSEILADGVVETFINTAIYINSAILIMSLIPTHYFFGEIKGVETDGLQIIKAVRNHRNNK